MAKVGIQMMIFREEVKKEGVYSVIKRVKEIGYPCIEMSQIEMSEETVRETKRACDEFGVEVAACSASVLPPMPGAESLSTHFDKIVADCKFLNCKFLRIGMLPSEYIGAKEKALEFSKICDDYASRLKEHGIELYYHNHHIEFIKYDDKFMLDIMRDSTELLGFELDVHWIQRGGADPVGVIKDYGSRARLIHLKDYKVVAPDFSGIEKDDFAGRFNAFSNVIRFGTVGDGSLNMPAIIDAGLAIEAKYMFVEQDNTYGEDPFVCIKRSADKIKELGYHQLF